MNSWRVLIAFGPAVGLYVWMLRDCAITRCNVCRGRVAILTVVLLWLAIFVGVHVAESWSSERIKMYYREAPVRPRR
jgi:hypothetical protein